MEARVSLSGFARTLALGLPQMPSGCNLPKSQNVIKEEHYTFSAESLPQVLTLVVTSDLVMTKNERRYGNGCRVDVVHFYASGQTHRELAVLILAALFSGTPQRVALDLEHEASAIKRLEINYCGFSRGSCWDYTRKPERFTYHPAISDRIPWNSHLDEKDLPIFNLDFSEGSGYHPVNDLDKRDKVEIDGGDDALVLVADLLLNIGLPARDVSHTGESIPPDKTYVLESSFGHQRVRKWSAEAQFHLPNSFSWPGEYPTLDSGLRASGKEQIPREARNDNAFRAIPVVTAVSARQALSL